MKKNKKYINVQFSNRKNFFNTMILQFKMLNTYFANLVNENKDKHDACVLILKFDVIKFSLIKN